MNIILTLTSILIFVFSLLPAQVHAASNTYYVTQNGNGAKDGKSLVNAWSVSDFNSSANWTTTDNTNKIDPGDTVYFSGKITEEQVTVPNGYGGTAGNYITLDGWQGGTCDPVANSGCASAAILYQSGVASNGSVCMRSYNSSYLIIQDFVMTNSDRGIIAYGDYGVTSNVIIRRNYIYNMWQHGLQVSQMNYVTIGGANGDGNFVYDTNKKAIPLDTQSDGTCHTQSGVNDYIFSYNKLTNSFVETTDASNVSTFGTGSRGLIEYNTFGNPSGQSCASLKGDEPSPEDRVFRFNKCYGAGQSGMASINTNRSRPNKNYVYGNLTYDSGGCFNIGRHHDDIYIWSNLCLNTRAEDRPNNPGGVGGYFSGDQSGDVYVYNNTFSRNDIAGEEGHSSAMRVYGNWQQNIRIKNNIFYYAAANDKDRQIWVDKGKEGQVSALDYNSYYTSGTPYFYWAGASRTLAWMVSNTSHSDNDSTADPSFCDPDGADNTHGTTDDDYTLQSDSPAINTGADLSECFYPVIQGKTYTICFDDGLDPANTDWTTTPPTVTTIKRDTYGWSRGAYVYKNGSGSSEDVVDAPRQLRIIN